MNKFRFRNKKEVDEVVATLRNGGTASPAILREVKLYTSNPEKYPFKNA